MLSTTAPKIQIRIPLATKYLLYKKTNINVKEAGVGPFKTNPLNNQVTGKTQIIPIRPELIIKRLSNLGSAFIAIARKGGGRSCFISTEYTFNCVCRNTVFSTWLTHKVLLQVY